MNIDCKKKKQLIFLKENSNMPRICILTTFNK